MPDRQRSTVHPDAPERERRGGARAFLADRRASREQRQDRRGAVRTEDRPAVGTGGRPAVRTEDRPVRAADPRLSAETNARLTQELRDVVGADRARVPVDRPHATLGERPRRQTMGAYISNHRFQLLRATMIMLTFGAIISLITNDWWLLPLAAGVHALGTMVVTLTIVGMTTMSEHPSPAIAAAMAAEGVASPDERFTEMVDEFRGVSSRQAGEVLSPGYNDRTAEAVDDPLLAGAEQSSAMTPTSGPSAPGGGGAAPDYVIWSTAVSLIILSIVLPPFFGSGWLWLLPAVMVPLVAGWMVLQRAMITRQGRLHIDSRWPLVAIALSTAVAVAIFCAVVAIAYTT